MSDTPADGVADGRSHPCVRLSPTPQVPTQNDIAHARVDTAAIARIWATMALTGRHTYQVLTKRPGRLARLLNDPGFLDAVAREATAVIGSTPTHSRWRLDLGGNRLAGDPGAGRAWTVTGRGTATMWLPPWPLPNVWVGTSIELDRYCWRADVLRTVPAAIRFLSCEPLLGPLSSLDLASIDWLIVGGESGPEHRPMDLDWVRDLRDRRGAAAFFFKQVGGHTPKAGGRLLDGRTWDEYPDPTEPFAESEAAAR